MTTGLPRLAFFGATGGCAANALALALKAGHQASALARTPSKLRNLMETEHGVSSSVLDKQLTIITGSIYDAAPVKQTLAPSGVPANIIISGLGAAPKLSLSLTLFTIDDPNLCENGVKIIIQALRDLVHEGTIRQDQKPLLLAISSTGLSKTRDVPVPYVPLYYAMLAKPHEDKHKMEDVIANAAAETGPDAPLGGFVLLRPTLLYGDAKGVKAIRTGWEKHPDAPAVGTGGKGTAPAKGYGISRPDVGGWIFEEVIKGDGWKWSGKCVSMTT